jgi:hypothetical protein
MRLKAVLFLLALAVTVPAWANPTYYIDEPRFYRTTVSGRTLCYSSEIELPDDTHGLIDKLVADGWSGIRYTGVDAWGADWVEHNWDANGIDYLEADNALLAVFAGHGASPNLGFTFAYATPFGPGYCQADYTNMSLGLNAGAHAAFLIALSCCTMTEYWIYPNSQLRQMFGFAGLAYVDDTFLPSFYTTTNVLTNTDSWLANTEDRPGWFTGNNSPSVFAAADNSTDAWDYLNWCQLRAGTCLYVPGKPLNGYAFSYLDNGCSGCYLPGCQ